MSGRGFIKHIRWTGPGGIQWDIAAFEVARLYADEKASTAPHAQKTQAYDQAREEIMNDDALLIRWVTEELSWEDIAPIATLVSTHRPEFERIWHSGNKEIVIYRTF